MYFLWNAPGAICALIGFLLVAGESKMHQFLIALLFITGPQLTSPAKQKTATVSLDGLIAVKFEKQKYVVNQAEAVKGVQFKYQIIVKKNLPGMIPQKQTSAAIPSGSSLLPLAKITGNKQFYGIVDIGLGPPIPPKAKTIKKGVYKGILKWDGKNWQGPSDFGAKKGKVFPPGMYVLSVTMIGKKRTAKGLKSYKVSKNVALILK